VEQVHGRCIGCTRPYALSRLQFVDERRGWATATDLVAANGHLSQYSVMVRTKDGGRTWRPMPRIETYGVEVEPAFSFLDAKTGWIGWSEPAGDTHTERTTDGGRTWHAVAAPAEGTWVDLQLFDSRTAAGTVATPFGARFCRTKDGGESWSVHPLPF